MMFIVIDLLFWFVKKFNKRFDDHKINSRTLCGKAKRPTYGFLFWGWECELTHSLEDLSFSRWEMNG